MLDIYAKSLITFKSFQTKSKLSISVDGDTMFFNVYAEQRDNGGSIVLQRKHQLLIARTFKQLRSSSPETKLFLYREKKDFNTQERTKLWHMTFTKDAKGVYVLRVEWNNKGKVGQDEFPISHYSDVYEGSNFLSEAARSEVSLEELLEIIEVRQPRIADMTRKKREFNGNGGGGGNWNKGGGGGGSQQQSTPPPADNGGGENRADYGQQFDS